MSAKLPEKDLDPFRLKSYNNKVMFHSKYTGSKNGLRTKKSDPEPNFFMSSSYDMWDVVGHMWGIFHYDDSQDWPPQSAGCSP